MAIHQHFASVIDRLPDERHGGVEMLGQVERRFVSQLEVQATARLRVVGLQLFGCRENVCEVVLGQEFGVSRVEVISDVYIFQYFAHLKVTDLKELCKMIVILGF